MADSKTTALTETTSPALTDIAYIVTDPGTTPTSKKVTVDNLIYTAIQASQLVNEIKGWPPVVNTGDLDALNLWWDKVGTPTTAPSVVAVSGEGITETYKLALKCVADANAEGLSQRWTYADEPRVKSGRKLSVILAIWSVSSVSVTAKLVNSDASNTAASAVTAAGWSIVKVENHTLAGTYCDLTVTTGGAGTFYVVPLGANIGPKAIPLRPRGLRYVDIGTATVVNNVDPGGATFADVDLTASTSNLATEAKLCCGYKETTGAGHGLYLRRNGSSAAASLANMVVQNSVTTSHSWVDVTIQLDDGQIFEYQSDPAAAGEVESVYISVLGWWEWE